MGILIIVAVILIGLCVYLAKQSTSTTGGYDTKKQKKFRESQTDPVDKQSILSSI